MRFLAGLLLPFLLLAAMPASAAALAVIPAMNSSVVDATDTLSREERADIEARILPFEARKGSQLQVLVVASTQPESIEQYAVRAFEHWKLGRKGVDDGVLVVVARDDHAVRIEVGYGLEGAIPDVTAGRVMDERMLPKFREDDYAGGIADGVETLIGLVDGEPLPPPDQTADQDQEQAGSSDNTGAIAALVAMLLAAGAGALGMLKKLRWPLAMGCALATGFVCGLLARQGIGAAVLIAIGTTIFGFPFGAAAAKTRAVRIALGAMAGIAVLLWLLDLVLGHARIGTIIGIAFGSLVAAAFLCIPIAGAVYAWRHKRTGFWIRVGALAVMAVIALAYAAYEGTRFDEAWPPFALLGFVVTTFTFVSAFPRGSGDGSRSSGGSSSSSRSSSSSSSSSGSSRSGGGGSSGGGGASRRW